MSASQQQSESYQNGWHAHEIGVGKYYNPYDARSANLSWREWRRGWEAAAEKGTS